MVMVLLSYINPKPIIMKKLAFLLAVCLSVTTFAQQKNSTKFYARFNNDKEKVAENLTKVKADDVWMLMLGVSIEPKSLDGMDHIEVVITRNSEKAIWKMNASDFVVNAGNDEIVAGNKVVYPKVVNFRENPEDGKGDYYSDIYNTKMGADFYLSKKATDYSNSVSVNDYVLTGAVYGYKLITYVKEKDLNGEWQTVPKYSAPITLAKTSQVTIITSDKIKPMPKTESIGDVNDLLNIGK